MPTPRAADDARRPARPVHAHRRRTALAVLAAVGAAASVLTACTDEPAAEPPAPPSVSASPTTEPTPTPTTTPEPERPAAMDDPGVDGAVATATYFLSLYPYVYNTGDLTAWKSLSHPECIFCTSVVTNAEEMHAKGHHQEGGAAHVTDSYGVDVSPEFFSVDLHVSQEDAREYDAEGTLVDTTYGARSVLKLAVLRESGAWVIREGEVVSDAA